MKKETIIQMIGGLIIIFASIYLATFSIINNFGMGVTCAIGIYLFVTCGKYEVGE